MQIRCLYEGVTVQDMLAHWDTLLPEYMAKWGLKRADVSKHDRPVSERCIATPCNCSPALRPGRAKMDTGDAHAPCTGA